MKLELEIINELMNKTINQWVNENKMVIGIGEGW